MFLNSTDTFKLMAAKATEATAESAKGQGILDKLGENFDLTSAINNLSPAGIFLTMITAVICAVIIYFVYKLFYKGVVYSENFNLLLPYSCYSTIIDY